MSNEYKAYLHVRRFDTRESVKQIGLTSLRDRHVERVMLGLLHNMNTDEYFVDESEIDAARNANPSRRDDPAQRLDDMFEWTADEHEGEGNEAE